MALKKYNPTSAGRRFQTSLTFEEITDKRPEKSLTTGMRSTGGRNSQGRVTSRYMGGGHKRLYRIIDFRRDKMGVPARVAAIEYDPNRTARIALLHYADGEKRYILAPNGLNVGAQVVAGPAATLRATRAAEGDPSEDDAQHRVEARAGGQWSVGRRPARSAKRGATQVRLPRRGPRKSTAECYARSGRSATEHENVPTEAGGTAGRAPPTCGAWP